MAGHAHRPSGAQQYTQYQDQLARAVASVDGLTGTRPPREQVGEMLDWMAHFTREHFGLQQRLLQACTRQRAYVLERMEVHGEFRRQLAQLCLDLARGDPEVPERLRALCHRILEDACVQGETIARLMGESAARVRQRPRWGDVDDPVLPGSEYGKAAQAAAGSRKIAGG